MNLWKNKHKRRTAVFVLLFTYILFFLICLIRFVKFYCTEVMQIQGFAQVYYTLNANIAGADDSIIEGIGYFLRTQGIPVLLATALLILSLLILKKPDLFQKWPGASQTVLRLIKPAAVIICISLVFSSIDTVEALGIPEYIEGLSQNTELFDEYYVKPSEETVTFPEEKRNLIHIYLESMETTFADAENGGGYAENLIPYLTELANESGNTDFSAADSTPLNGALVTQKTNWTIAGIVAQTAGLPLTLANSDFVGSSSDESEFMPNIISLGDLLQEQGYTNVFMCGSEIEFAGRGNYLSQHGDYEIFDYTRAKEDGFIEEDYKVWWGLEDEKLYEYAKQELETLAKSDEPFNFTLLTADTHTPDGYLCPNCPDDSDSQYENVIRCADQQVYDFVRWIQEQDFYENTTIVISGDHISMDSSVEESMSEGYSRKVYFNIINAPVTALDTERVYTTLDIFPTIVESLGAEIENGRLGIGTSLYSDTPTLAEMMGYTQLNEEIGKRSYYYEAVVLNGDDRTDEEPSFDEPDLPVSK